MKRLFTLLCIASYLTAIQAQGVYQIPNSDFENWKSDKEPGNGWNSFASARTSDLNNFIASIAKNQSPTPKKVQGYNSANAVALFSKDLGIAKANGNLTTGKINMGSTAPDDKKNYNYTDLTSSVHSLLFAGTPDSVSCMAQFTSGGSDKGRGQFILHDNYNYKDPESSNESGYEGHKMAMATVYITETADWKYFSAPFEYTNNTATANTQYMLASFTTNPIPGGSANDTLIIDDVKLIYNSELSSLIYDNKDIFEKGQTDYDLSNMSYEASKISYTSNGRGATVEPSYDKATSLLTLTVKGNDWSVTNPNQHVYTIQFAKEVVETQQYSNTLLVNAFGTPAEPTQNTINLIRYKDGSYSFELKQFAFGGVSMGDIVINNLDVLTENDITTYSKANEMVYIEGLGTEVPVNLKATVSKGNMTATINIPLGEGMEVNVSFAPCLIIDNTQDVIVETDGLYNITFNRLFPAGWSSICLPYATTTENLGAVQVQAFTGCDQNTLTFQKVGNGELAAHTPYLIYFENATTKSDTPWFCIDGISAGKPTSVTHGNVTFVGNYEAGKNMEGLYGVAEKAGEQYIMRGGKGSTLGSTGAYFTVSGSEVNTLRIRLEGTGTGISDVEAGKGGQTFDIYSLNGIKVRSQATTTDGLPKGIYLINGKKHIVK